MFFFLFQSFYHLVAILILQPIGGVCEKVG